MFEVTINFGDDTPLRPRVFETYSELSSWLERVPNMFGFLANETTKIEIKVLQPLGPIADPRTYLLN